MSLHDQVIEWLKTELPEASKNHSNGEKIYNDDGKYIVPDLIEGQKLHEVEAVDLEGKARYLTLSRPNQLWISVRGYDIFDSATLLLIKRGASTPTLKVDLVTLLPSLMQEEGQLRKEVEKLRQFLKSNDAETLKEVKIQHERLKVEIEELKKDKNFMDAMKILAKSGANPDKNCPSCPFFTSWLKDALSREGKEEEEEDEEG
jgi:hypothetical protein